MSISLSSVLNGMSSVPATPADPFQAGLNQLAQQVQQLQAQTTAAGASAYNNATLINAFNALCNTVGQYQTSVTTAGAAGARYQATLNGIDLQLNQVKTALTMPAGGPPIPYGRVYGTDTYTGVPSIPGTSPGYPGFPGNLPGQFGRVDRRFGRDGWHPPGMHHGGEQGRWRR